MLGLKGPLNRAILDIFCYFYIFCTIPNKVFDKKWVFLDRRDREGPLIRTIFVFFSIILTYFAPYGVKYSTKVGLFGRETLQTLGST